MKDNKSAEDMRLILSAGILASVLAIFSVVKNSIYAPIKVIMVLSGILIFAYILLSADKLRYKFDPELHYLFKNGKTHEKWRKRFYDWSINVYFLALGGYGILVALSIVGIDIYGADSYLKQLWSAIISFDNSQLGIYSLLIAIILMISVWTIAYVIKYLTIATIYIGSVFSKRKKSE